MKVYVILVLLHIATYKLSQLLPLICSIVYYLTIAIFFIKLLNYFATIPDLEPFNPIHKQKISTKTFYDHIKSLDTEGKYLVSDFTFQTKDGYDLTVFRVS